jgi:hypothetical protein
VLIINKIRKYELELHTINKQILLYRKLLELNYLNSNDIVNYVYNMEQLLKRRKRLENTLELELV